MLKSLETRGLSPLPILTPVRDKKYPTLTGSKLHPPFLNAPWAIPLLPQGAVGVRLPEG